MATGPALNRIDLEPHREAVEKHHRFSGVTYRGEAWDLSHLNAFAFRCDPGLGFAIDVVVLFSCHCFSHEFKHDLRPPEVIPLEEVYADERERRVLSPERYELSKRFLPRLVEELHARRIQIAPDDRGAENFFTLELFDAEGATKHYAVFIEPTRDARRKRRLLLRVQSAYVLDKLSKRMKDAGKVSFDKLLKAAYLGERVGRRR